MEEVEVNLENAIRHHFPTDDSQDLFVAIGRNGIDRDNTYSKKAVSGVRAIIRHPKVFEILTEEMLSKFISHCREDRNASDDSLRVFKGKFDGIACEARLSNAVSHQVKCANTENKSSQKSGTVRTQQVTQPPLDR